MCFTVSGHWQVAHSVYHGLQEDKSASNEYDQYVVNTESRRDRHIFRL